jgi:uncharacterized protein
MSERNGYEPGVPCWVDTWQPDARTAADFYAHLFGWETVGPAPRAFMCKLRGRDAPSSASGPTSTSIFPSPGARTSGWRMRTRPPPGGRMVVVSDPSGAVIAAWQPGAHNGAQLVNEAGAWSWSQLYTPDPDGSKAFYGAVFGWETETFGDGEGAPTMWRVPGYLGGEPEQPVSRDVVAGMARSRDDAPAQWQIDFWVDDVDATVAKAEEMGGRAVVPAYDASIRQAVLADPQRAVFTVSKITVEG